MKCNFNFAIYALLCSCFLDVNAELSKADGGVSQLWKELNELKAVLTETRLDLFHTRRELKGTKDVLAETRVRLEIMEKKQEKTRETLMETSRDLVETQTDLKETKKLIDQNEGKINVIHKSQTPIIGFTSTISKDVVNLGDNQVIRFDTVYTNEGGDYNNLTGIFTCEIPGLYAFYVHTLAEPGKHLETEITKNLKPMVYTYAYDKEAFSSGSNMAVMILQKGDTVLVRSHGSEHSHNGSVIDFWYTSFSGFLIAP